MKKSLLFILFYISIGFSSLLANETAFVSILKNVSIPNVDKTIQIAKELQQNQTSENFTKLVESWKKVEALYFAGDIDENYIDTPRYIDVFHNLKEDLSIQMKRVISSTDEVKIALFKNSFKTINALEYVLFNDKKITNREKLLSIEILNSIISNLEDIKNVYKEYLTSKSKGEKWENALIINTLISSSYRLKEWRIGEPSGIAAKYKNDARNDRAEYFLSQNSFNAIKAILEAHAEIMLDKSYYNFASMVKENGALKEALQVDENISKSLNIINNQELKDDFTKVEKLYAQIKELHNAYYISLVEQLSVTAKILDADGD